MKYLSVVECKYKILNDEIPVCSRIQIQNTKSLKYLSVVGRATASISEAAIAQSRTTDEPVCPILA